VVLCYVIWDLLSKHWSKNLAEIQFLKSGVELLSLFEEKDYHLKQGLCVMLWNANFKIPLKATQKLINKTGRLPKEKLCLQNTMIPDFLMPQFLEQTLIFLDDFRTSINYERLEFKCEEILGSSSQSLSLCELILNQQKGNLPLLNLHYEMLKVLELIAFLNIKYTKPMQSLFDEVANDAFFSEINKQMAHSLNKADEIRQNTRVYFLKKAISTTIDLIVECQSNTYFDDHLKWIEKIKIVGRIWELDIGLLERHHVSILRDSVASVDHFPQQIVELYVNGFDDLADELIEKVASRERIVKQLLDIAGKRLTLHLEVNKDSWRHVASGGSLLTNYLETIHGRKDDAILENVKSTDVNRLYKLTYKIFQTASMKNFSDSRALR
jgi:Rab3 GTPase-activating protein non-catalytic subunit